MVGGTICTVSAGLFEPHSGQSRLLSAQMKDLKRQLAQERKRADRLEQKVQDLVTDLKPHQPSGTSIPPYFCGFFSPLSFFFLSTFFVGGNLR